MYKIDHEREQWVVSDEELPVQNAFHGHHHQAEGYFDWAYKHNRMVEDGSKFYIDFDLPDRVKHAGNEVSLSIGHFTGWQSSSSTVHVSVNGERVAVVEVKSEDKGRTVSEINVPFHLLHLHGSGKSNKITYEFVSGYACVFMWYFKVLANLQPAAPIAFP